MPARRDTKCSRLHINNQMSRSQALAFLAHNDVNQCTEPAVVVNNRRSSEVEHVDQKQDEGGTTKMLSDDKFDSFAASQKASSTYCDSDSESSLEGRFPQEDLSAGDVYTAEQQLHVMLGGNFHNAETSQAAEDGEMQPYVERLLLCYCEGWDDIEMLPLSAYQLLHGRTVGESAKGSK
jgi:hypothetical protein